ncbi:MAG: DUF1684 domain-containing protein [Candidatus Hodarchaeales archaeon]|jgi:uncharacterized protein (DUF1684 family)
MSEQYEDSISEGRKNREKIVNEFRKEQDQDPTSFEYYGISSEWRVPASIILRTPKEGVSDYKINFDRIGKIKFEIKGTQGKGSLYKLKNTKEMYTYLKDLTSGKSTYGLGRFVPVFQEGENYFLDFNLACTPACGHVEGSACPWAKDNVSISIEAGEKAPKYE